MMGRAILPHFLLLSSSPPQLSSSLYYLHLYLNSPILYAVHILIQSQAGHSLDFQANISKLGANSSKCKMRDALLVSVATPLSHSRSLLLQRVLRALRTWNLTQRPECNNLLSVYQLISRKTRVKFAVVNTFPLWEVK
ncbi:uncharacterized protein LOC110603118 isoform X2 [Manihot esculenta]|uniref:uncharacterized protein LOC110603118 isoform X2 n=1 Tax=Manihot esculenta TaxID=3983 RepID=UPI000B5D2D71|nr:uncharacterized protein LOC110603118 isoform X2 [Manihot esculenta]